MHLVEDQAVPAHAYNIRHGAAVPMDNMEEMVFFWGYHPADITANTGVDHTWHYNTMRNYTLSKTLYQDDQSYWHKYWQIIEPYDVTIDGKVYAFDGRYGGESLSWGYEEHTYKDNFPLSWSGSENVEAAGATEKDLTSDLLGQAVARATGALMTISQTLPPLTKDLAIDGATEGSPAINTETGSNITFNLYENRQPDVYVTIAVDSPDGPATVDADSGMPVSHVWSNHVNERYFEK